MATTSQVDTGLDDIAAKIAESNAARTAGMQSVLIRGEQYPTLFHLAEAMQ